MNLNVHFSFTSIQSGVMGTYSRLAPASLHFVRVRFSALLVVLALRMRTDSLIQCSICSSGSGCLRTTVLTKTKVQRLCVRPIVAGPFPIASEKVCFKMSVSIFETMKSGVDADLLSSDALFYPSCENATTVTDISQFNFSEFDYPGGGGPWPSPLGFISAMKITFCVINMIVSILGNCAVIIAVYHNPALRSTINFYLVNGLLTSLYCALFLFQI